MIGEVCHIRAGRPGGGRFDPTQTERARHAFDNLILLCPTHHTVVDADTEAYTVERLIRMKSDHERAAVRISAEDVDHGAGLLIGSANIAASGGGVAAAILNVGSLITNPTRNSALDERKVRAIDIVWGASVALSNAMLDLIYIDGILLPEEIQQCIDEASPSDSMTRHVHSFPSELAMMERIRVFTDKQVEHQQPYVPRLYAMFFVHQAIMFRAAILMSQSVAGGTYKDWRADSLIRQHLASMFIDTEVNDLLTWRAMGLNNIAQSIQARMQTEISQLVQ